MQELLRLDEAAQRLGVHVVTMRAWVRERRIPAYRLGQRFVRVDWADVLRAVSVANHRTDPRAAPGLPRSEPACDGRGAAGAE